VIHNGYEKWPLDVKICTSMRVGNQNSSGCGMCIKVCHWNKSQIPFHRIANWMLRNVPSSRNIAVHSDDWFGYGKPDPESKWWLDIEEEENGEFRIAHQKERKTRC